MDLKTITPIFSSPPRENPQIYDGSKLFILLAVVFFYRLPLASDLLSCISELASK
jgi:hypothetical protein